MIFLGLLRSQNIPQFCKLDQRSNAFCHKGAWGPPTGFNFTDLPPTMEKIKMTATIILFVAIIVPSKCNMECYDDFSCRKINNSIGACTSCASFSDRASTVAANARADLMYLWKWKRQPPWSDVIRLTKTAWTPGSCLTAVTVKITAGQQCECYLVTLLLRWVWFYATATSNTPSMWRSFRPPRRLQLVLRPRSFRRHCAPTPVFPPSLRRPMNKFFRASALIPEHFYL